MSLARWVGGDVAVPPLPDEPNGMVRPAPHNEP